MAATKFAFEERTAPVDWPRVASADVRRLEKLGDVVALRSSWPTCASGILTTVLWITSRSGVNSK